MAAENLQPNPPAPGAAYTRTGFPRLYLFRHGVYYWRERNRWRSLRTKDPREASIARRLMLLNVVAAVALLAVTGFGIYQTRQVYEAASYANDNTVPSFLVLDGALKAYDAMTQLTSKHVAETDSSQMQSIEQRIAAQSEKMQAQLTQYESLLSDEKDREMLAADRAAAAQSSKVRDQVLALSRANQKQQAADA